MTMRIICSSICAHEELNTPVDLDIARGRFIAAETEYLDQPLSRDKFYGFIRATMDYSLVARDLGIQVGATLQESLLRSECRRAEVAETAALEALDIEPLSMSKRSDLSLAAAQYDRAYTAWEQFKGGYPDEVMATLFSGAEDDEAKREWEDRMVEAVDITDVVDPGPWVEERAVIMADELADASLSAERDR